MLDDQSGKIANLIQEYKAKNKEDLSLETLELSKLVKYLENETNRKRFDVFMTDYIKNDVVVQQRRQAAIIKDKQVDEDRRNDLQDVNIESNNDNNVAGLPSFDNYETRTNTVVRLKEGTTQDEEQFIVRTNQIVVVDNK